MGPWGNDFVVVLSKARTDRCAMCGTLLHGDVHLNSSACSNKKYGPPVDRNGVKLQEPDGAPSTLAQPPCLLRLPCTTVPGCCVCSFEGGRYLVRARMCVCKWNGTSGSLRACSQRRRRRCSNTMGTQTVSGWRRVRNVPGFATHAPVTPKAPGSSVSVTR